MSAFMSKPFSKWAASEEISNDDLRGALTEIVGGLIDAELGGGVIKKEWVLRIAYFGLSGHLFRFHPARRFGVIRPA